MNPMAKKIANSGAIHNSVMHCTEKITNIAKIDNARIAVAKFFLFELRLKANESNSTIIPHNNVTNIRNVHSTGCMPSISSNHVEVRTIPIPERAEREICKRGKCIGNKDSSFFRICGLVNFKFSHIELISLITQLG